MSGYSSAVKEILNHDKCDSDTIKATLMIAAQRGDLEVVRAMLDHVKCGSPIINATNNLGQTALMMAANEDHKGTVKAILDHKEGETHTVSVDQAIEDTLGAEQKGNEGIANMIRHHRNIPDRKIELYKEIKEIKELERKVKKKVLSNKVKSHSFVALAAIAVAATVYYRFGKAKKISN